MGNGNEHPNAGFLDSTLIPVPIGDASKGLENIKSPSYLSETNFRRRLSLAAKIDSDFREKFSGREIDTYNEMYREAVRLMGSKELAAFDILQESEETREAYGTHRFGQGCLLARRLVQSGVRFVEVEFGSWDMHQQIFTELPERAGQLDQSMSKLITDLKESGLWKSTLVVLATEFGRTPTINENAGRDHHPGSFRVYWLEPAFAVDRSTVPRTKMVVRSTKTAFPWPISTRRLRKRPGLTPTKNILLPMDAPSRLVEAGKPSRKCWHNGNTSREDGLRTWQISFPTYSKKSSPVILRSPMRMRRWPKRSIASGHSTQKPVR